MLGYIVIYWMRERERERERERVYFILIGGPGSATTIKRRPSITNMRSTEANIRYFW